MAERMLVTQALDERDLLVKKIGDRIRNASFVDTVKHNERMVYDSRLTREDFAKQAESAYQQIIDLIDRYQKIDAAIVNSNANTWIDTLYGRYTIQSSLALRSRLRDTGIYEEADFEGHLCEKMLEEYQLRIQFIENKNEKLQDAAEEMRLSILGRESKEKDERPLEVVEVYVKENTTELVDPLGIQKKIADISEKKDVLLKELDTKIKVSNATTFIEI